MNDDERLLHALLADPNPKLPVAFVYADWLEEQGDPRGDYLRTAATLAVLPRGHEWRANLTAQLAVLRPCVDPAWESQVAHRLAMLTGLRFLPSRGSELARLLNVRGNPGAQITEVTVFPDRLEFEEGGPAVVRFADIAVWQHVPWLRRSLARLGLVQEYPAVGERYWFHSPTNRFFRFFTSPPIMVLMPDEPVELPYAQTTFARIQAVIHAGGYTTYDLG